MPHFPQTPSDAPRSDTRRLYTKWTAERRAINWRRTHVAGDRGRPAPMSGGLVERLLSWGRGS